MHRRGVCNTWSDVLYRAETHQVYETTATCMNSEPSMQGTHARGGVLTAELGSVHIVAFGLSYHLHTRCMNARWLDTALPEVRVIDILISPLIHPPGSDCHGITQSTEVRPALS